VKNKANYPPDPVDKRGKGTRKEAGRTQRALSLSVTETVKAGVLMGEADSKE